MNVNAWVSAFELAEVNIPQAAAYLLNSGATDQDLRNLVQTLRMRRWEFADTLADELGLHAPPMMAPPGYVVPGGFPQAVYQPVIPPGYAPYPATYAPVIPPQPTGGGWGPAPPMPYGQAYYAPPTQHPQMHAVQPGWQQQAFVNPGPVQPPPPVLSQADRAQYANLAINSGLFGTDRLTRVSRSSLPPHLQIADVAMDGMAAMVCTNAQQALGTAGLGPCIAVCARGIDPQGQEVIGLWHASYDEDQVNLRNNLRAGLGQLMGKMTRRHAAQVEFSLAGGMKQPNARCIEFGETFLSLRGEYPIVAAEIHHCEREDQATDVVVTSVRTYHGVSLYDPPPF